MVGFDVVGGEFSFPLHVDFSSEGDVVPHALDNLGGLLCHLSSWWGEGKKSFQC